ncbi:hypothetical protein HK097_004459, partial [Rhizophlyctis rosea]
MTTEDTDNAPATAILSPTVVTANIRRIPWKTLQQSTYFLLQQNSNSVAATGNGAVSGGGSASTVPAFRILTRSFPQYRVAAHNDSMLIHETWSFLHDTIIPSLDGKVTSKRIVKYIKDQLGHPTFKSKPPTHLLSDDDEEGFYTDESPDSDPFHHSHSKDSSFADSTINDIDIIRLAASEAFRNGINGERTDSPLPNSTSGESPTPLPRGRCRSSSEPKDLITGVTADDSHHQRPPIGTPPSRAKSTSNVQDSLLPSLSSVTDDEVSEAVEALANAEAGEANWLADGLAIVNGWLLQVETQGESGERNFLAVVQRWVGWLRVPVVEEGVKPTMAEIRETNLVLQRRFVLTCATLYAFLIRYVSFDFFLFILISSNFILLYAIKNSRKIN